MSEAAADPSPCPPELLAPAGNEEMMRAAIENGADAVYFGLPEFNARLRADNFRLCELPRIMDWIHERGVRGYVTLNTIIFSSEMEQAAHLLSECCRAGVDAVLVQDLGLAALAGRLAPGLEIHASTQMTLTAPESIAAVDQLGLRITRVVAPRELTLADLRTLKQQTDKEIEAFVHGALCISYSGQCLASEALGGRSANRGECAQACRLPYQLVVDGRWHATDGVDYPLSPRDLLGYESLPDLISMGIDGLKVEGRMKSPNYVAAAVQTYRTRIDAIIRDISGKTRPTGLDDETLNKLELTFSRGFTMGYLRGINHRDVVEGHSPGNRGACVGRVIRTTRRGVVVALESAVRPGDGIVFRSVQSGGEEEGGAVYELWCGEQRLAEYDPDSPLSDASDSHCNAVELTFGSGRIDLRRIRPGTLVWKTSDPQLESRLKASYAGTVVRHSRPVKVCVTAKPGEPLRLCMEDGDGRRVEVVDSKPAEEATTQPLTPHILDQQLSRLGGTPFFLEHLDCRLEGAPMVPFKRLNNLRRLAVDALLKARRAAHPARDVHPEALQIMRSKIPKPVAATASEVAPQVAALCRTLGQVEAALGSAEVHSIYGDFDDLDLHRRARQMVTWPRTYLPATLQTFRPGEEALVTRLLELRPDGILVRNLAAWHVLKHKAPGLALVGDQSLNIANDLTAFLLQENGLARLTPGCDLNIGQLLDLARHAPPEWFEVVVHQHLPMFHMEHCLFCRFLSSGTNHTDCGRPCERHRLALKDRMGCEHPVRTDAACRNSVYHGVAQSAVDFIGELLQAGIRNYRIEFLDEPAATVRETLDAYLSVLGGEVPARDARLRLRACATSGISRGTLDRE